MRKLLIAVVPFIVLTCSIYVLADGTETLGPPAIPIASGTGIIAAGTGMSTGSGTISINVPGAVQQVLLYWQGEANDPAGDNEIEVNGNLITGSLIGGPTLFYYNGGAVYPTTFRADITALGLVSLGANSLSVGGLDFGPPYNGANGAGLLVVYDDGSGTTNIEIRDGQDLAFVNFAPTLDTTVPQTFNFPSAGYDRTAHLVIFAGSVGANRPNEIVITVDGATTEFVNALGSLDGSFWDTLTLPVTIPALATNLTVEALSASDGSGNLPASFSWSTGALSVEIEESGTGRFTGGGHQIRVDGVRVTRGLTIHCDLLLSNNLEVNWQGNSFHMTEHLTTVSCTDDPNIIQFPPAAPLDTLVGVGTGRYNGQDGFTIEFTLVDAGEPGSDDEAALLIYETANPGNVVLDVPLQLLDGGNLQAHFDQPHR